ncbi:MAG TPA: methyltransferase domain-containing protein [Acidimicrobiales bacterium]|nr:methyltransferase domain-containing protein [Acidimicrobiales bacterium]
MTAVNGEGTAEHSRSQRRYFERASHRTLKPTGSPYLRRHVDLMCEFAEIGTGDRVLEVGCGLGRYTLLLAERGVAVEGLDLSQQLLDELQSYNAGRYRIPTHALDIIDCPPEMDGAFDAVIGFFVLHHVHDLDACLAAMARMVRPGGRVAFLEPNPVNPLYYVQITLTPEMNWEGERGMLRMRTREMFPAMEKAGLRELGFRRFGLFPPFVTNRALGAKMETALEGVPLGPLARPFHLFGGRRPAAAGV